MTPIAFEGGPKSPSSGYHPPLPPKPQHITKSPRESTSSTSAAVPSTINVDAQERELLRELLFAFQGIEGVILRREAQADDVGGFVVHASYRDKFSPSVIQLTLRLANLGWMFNVVHQFCEKTISEREIGLISLSFVTALKEELSDYYQLLTNLEAEFLKDKMKSLSLHQLSVFTLEPMCR